MGWRSGEGFLEAVWRNGITGREWPEERPRGETRPHCAT